MSKGLKNLSSKEYPGRVIIIGQDNSGENTVVIYVITGRSPSSQARKLDYDRNTIWVKPLDEEILKKGNIDLLIYPAIFILSQGIAVSNGKQTKDIKTCLEQSQNTAEILALALQKWSFEPDAPTYTPRISGCVLSQKRSAFSLIKRALDGSSEKTIFEFSLKAGQGKMIATYTGENKDPLPSFFGEPVSVEIEKKTAADMAEEVYKALKPTKKEKDFRVGVACVFFKNLESGQYNVSIINRYERGKD